MSEGWEDCPVLPVGWKRREVYRRSGATIGKSDTYYMSPTAERFRSKVEMVKYFGESIDLSYFDFKRGIIVSPDAKMRRSVKRLSASPSGRDEGQPRPCQDPKKRPKTETEPALALALASPLPLADSPAANGAGMGGLNAEPLDTLIACCEDCQQWVPGVLFGPGKRHVRFYCAECRAKRRELGRKLNYYKRFGCGDCTGCAVPSDCGECRSCAARSGGSGKRWTCERRWCHKLREIKAETQGRKSLGEPKKRVKLHTHRTKKMMIYRTLPPDTAHEPTPVTTPTPGAQAHVPTKKIKSAHRVEKKMLQKAKAGPGRKLHAVQQENPALQPTPPTNVILADDTPSTPCAESTEASGLLPRACRGRRNSRVCGECTACRRAADCGVCDFCRDKAKFGGANTLRQKCRWKQCLCFASKRLLPREMLGESPWAEWKETGYRGSRRGKWKENVFASRKVARIIQAARKRKIWQSSAHPPADRTPAPRTGTGTKTQPADDVEPAGGRTGSPARSEDGEERAGVHTPVKGSPSLKNSGCGTPEPKSTSEDKALNLKKFLSAMKPFLKGSRFTEAHDRPSVIRETSEWQKSGDSRQSPESTPQKPPAIPTPVPPESPDPDPDPARLPGATLPPEVSIEPAAPPVSRHREHKDRSHKKLPEESGLNGTGGHSLPQRLTEDRTDPSSSDKPPVSPQRPARPEARTPGTPSNSRMIKQGSPEHNQGYGRTPPTPITQIFSLGSPYMMMSLEPLLRTFTHDLMLLPLPASWVVCSSLGPDVQLIQLSRKSPVWDSVVQILPGFHYHVLVRGIPVPPAHRLYRSRPTRLSSAADVLELISDLETYRLCAGFPHLPLLLPTGRGLKVPLPPPVVAALLPHQRSSHCEVLVDKERCSRCTAAI